MTLISTIVIVFAFTAQPVYTSVISLAMKNKHPKDNASCATSVTKCTIEVTGRFQTIAVKKSISRRRFVGVGIISSVGNEEMIYVKCKPCTTLKDRQIVTNDGGTFANQTLTFVVNDITSCKSDTCNFMIYLETSIDNLNRNHSLVNSNDLEEFMTNADGNSSEKCLFVSRSVVDEVNVFLKFQTEHDSCSYECIRYRNKDQETAFNQRNPQQNPAALNYRSGTKQGTEQSEERAQGGDVLTGLDTNQEYDNLPKITNIFTLAALPVIILLLIGLTVAPYCCRNKQEGYQQEEIQIYNTHPSKASNKAEKQVVKFLEKLQYKPVIIKEISQVEGEKARSHEKLISDMQCSTASADDTMNRENTTAHDEREVFHEIMPVDIVDSTVTENINADKGSNDITRNLTASTDDTEITTQNPTASADDTEITESITLDGNCISERVTACAFDEDKKGTQGNPGADYYNRICKYPFIVLCTNDTRLEEDIQSAMSKVKEGIKDYQQYHFILIVIHFKNDDTLKYGTSKGIMNKSDGTAFDWDERKKNVFSNKAPLKDIQKCLKTL